MTTKKSKDNTAVMKQEHDSEVELAQDLPVFVPATDVYERGEALLVVCDLPGVATDRVDIRLEKDVLTVTAQQEDFSPEGADLLYRGYRTGIFRRSFTVTTPVDAGKIKANMKNGVLYITLPKTAESQPRKIKVEAD